MMERSLVDGTVVIVDNTFHLSNGNSEENVTTIMRQHFSGEMEINKSNINVY